jgi:hypothetical protein
LKDSPCLEQAQSRAASSSAQSRATSASDVTLLAKAALSTDTTVLHSALTATSLPPLAAVGTALMAAS